MKFLSAQSHITYLEIIIVDFIIKVFIVHLVLVTLQDQKPNHQYQLQQRVLDDLVCVLISGEPSEQDFSAMSAGRRPTRVPDSKVTNRNAINARKNRLLKKEKLLQMEKQIQELTAQNKVLTGECKRLQAIVDQMVPPPPPVQQLNSPQNGKTEIAQYFEDFCEEVFSNPHDTI